MPSYGGMKERDRLATLAAYDAAQGDSVAQQRLDLQRQRFEFDTAFKTAESQRKAEQEANMRAIAEGRNQQLQERIGISEAAQKLQEARHNLDRSDIQVKQELTNKFLSELPAWADDQNPYGSEGFMRRVVTNVLPKYSGLLAEKGSIVEDYATKYASKLMEIEDAKRRLAEVPADSVLDTITVGGNSTSRTYVSKQKDEMNRKYKDDASLNALNTQLIKAEKMLADDPTNENAQSLSDYLRSERDKRIASIQQPSATPASQPSATPSSTPATAQTVPELKDKSEFDALPSGSEYTRNGVRYRKP